MKHKDVSQLTNEELLTEALKWEYSPLLNALLVGIMGGIIIYSIFANTVSIFTLIPAFFVYLLIKNGERIKELQGAIESRDLKSVRGVGRK